MNFWSNKLVWITGASSGIGEALARELAPAGARLILSSRRAEVLETLRASLPNAAGHHVLPLDIGNGATLVEVLSLNRELLEKVDVLFNNAGISQRALMWEASPDSERQIMETNFFGATAVAKAVINGMLQRNSGAITVISSATGKFGFPLRSSYAASKHALHGYFESLRAELKGKNIQVTMVCPGRIKTNISFSALEADGKRHGQLDPGQAGGIPAEICARIILRAVEQQKAEIYIGKEQFLIYLNRFFPSLFRSMVRNINPQ